MKAKKKFTKFFNCECWITQYFGYTDFAKSHYASGYHEGLDLVPIDKVSFKLYTPMSGVVMYSGFGKDYGNNVIIWNEKTGMSMRVAHLKFTLLKEGQTVKVGKYIGDIGTSGNSTGIHLHVNFVPMLVYGVRDFLNNGFNGRVDPIPALRFLGVNI